MTTETEAKGKWCPMSNVFLRLANDTAAPMGNRVIQNKDGHGEIGYGHSNCLGSACMAWRKEEGSNMEGYCGMAGKP